MNFGSKEIQQLYIAYFARPADPSGINYWLTNSPKGTKIGDISKSLYSQPEYKESIIMQKPLDFQVNQFYINLFSRKADFEGINYCLYLIENESLSISDFVCNLISSIVTGVSTGSEQLKIDFQTLENKVHAAELFTKEVGSSISWINLYQPESIDPWIKGKALNSGVAFLSEYDCYKELSLNQVTKTLKSIRKLAS